MFHLLIAFGWFMSKIPEPLMKGFCWALGALFFSIPSKRLHIIYSNLHHAFPDRSPEWLKRTVWKVCQRTVEMGLFTLVSPHFSDKRMQSILSVSNEVERAFEKLLKQDRPILGYCPHFSMLEAFNTWVGFSSFSFPETVVMYRPHKNAKVNEMITRHRQRFGIKMVSRKVGLKNIGEVLRRKGMAVVLFDQNTRDSGSLLPFFGRATSATELPGLLTKKYNAIPLIISCYRTTFWRASVEISVLDVPMDAGALTLAANQWLEERMKQSEERLVDWLWSHNRWKILFRPFERLGMDHRKKLVDFSTYGIRKTRFAILHSDLSASLPALVSFIQALRLSRSDSEITLITRDAEMIQNKNASLIDVAYNLPSDKSEACRLAKALGDNYLDLVMVLDDEEHSRIFAKLTKIPQRFGVKLNGKKDKCLTDVWTPEEPESWAIAPDWIEFGKHFGLKPEAEDTIR